MTHTSGTNTQSTSEHTDDIQAIDSLITEISKNQQGPLYHHGYEIGNNLPVSATEEMVIGASKKVESWARSQISGRILDLGESYGQDRIDEKSRQANRLNDAIHPLDKTWADEEKEARQLAVELAELGDPPTEPKKLNFAIAGGLLGLIFGLMATTTIVDILTMILEPSDPEAVRTTYVIYSSIIGVMTGLSVGLLMLPITKYAVGRKGFIIQHGPFILGIFFALALGSYRLMGTDPDTGEMYLRVTALGTVMTLLELALLFGIEVVNLTLYHAYNRWHEAHGRYQRTLHRYNKERDEADKAKRALDDAVSARDRSENELAVLKRSIDRTRSIINNRDALIQQGVEHALAGFLKGRSDRQNEKRF